MSLPRRVVQLPCRDGDGRPYSEQNNVDGILDTSRSGNHQERTGRREDVGVSVGDRLMNRLVNPEGQARRAVQNSGQSTRETRQDFKVVNVYKYGKR
jgi:hypothetical protein